MLQGEGSEMINYLNKVARRWLRNDKLFNKVARRA